MAKKSILIGLLVFFMLILSFTVIKASANPLSNMSLSYNTNTQQLDVTITHLTGGTPGHYTEHVIIRVNGSIVHSEAYTSQPNPSTFTYQYNSIVANVGATINVWANCSLTGDTITRQLTVSDTNGTSSPDSTIPGYFALWVFLIACVITLTLLIYKKIRIR
ncbi:MAG: hypothetical protein ACFFE4_08600 [Candidatus Thorarchaeota archaeon]